MDEVKAEVNRIARQMLKHELNRFILAKVRQGCMVKLKGNTVTLSSPDHPKITGTWVFRVDRSRPALRVVREAEE